MLTNLGYGLRQPRIPATSSGPVFVVANTPRGTLFYDSIGNQFRAQTNVAGGFNDIMKTYFNPSTAGGLQDMSTDGCALLKSIDSTYFLIDDSSGADPVGWTRGTNYYTNVYNAMTTAANTSDYAIIVSGTNDATVGSPITKSKYKQALAKLKEFIQADFAYIQCAFLMPIHRSDYAPSVNANYNIVREAAREKCTEDSWFKILPDMYDLDLADTAHFTTSVYQTTLAERVADCIAYVFGKRSITGVYGPQVTSASFETGHLLLNVTHDEGTDFTSIPALTNKTLALRVGTTDYKTSSVTRISATQLKADLENVGLVDGTIASAVIAHGTMAELSGTSAEVIKDNATKAKPLRSGVVTLTNNDPLFNVHNLSLDLIPKTAAKTFSSGVLVTQATDRMNGYWEMLGTTREPTYDEMAFGGQGALTSGDSTTFMMSNTVFTKSNTGWGGMVFEVPASTAGSKYIVTWGTASAGSALIALYFTNTGILNFIENSAGGSTALSSDLRGTKNILIWNFRSTSTVDFYLNNNAVVTLDPRDSLIAYDKISLFNRTSSETGGTVGFKIGRIWHKNTAHDAGGIGTDPAIVDIISSFRTKYGLSF
jgi:hypothetical protein